MIIYNNMKYLLLQIETRNISIIEEKHSKIPQTFTDLFVLLNRQSSCEIQIHTINDFKTRLSGNAAASCSLRSNAQCRCVIVSCSRPMIHCIYLLFYSRLVKVMSGYLMSPIIFRLKRVSLYDLSFGREKTQQAYLRNHQMVP